MIKVLHIVGKMDRAGLETMIMNYYRNIDRNLIQFDFLILSGEKGAYDDEIEKLGGKIYYPDIKYKWSNILLFIKWFKKTFSNSDYSILHSHNGGADFLFPLAKKYGMKIIVHCHNTHSVEEGILKKFLRKISKTINYNFVDLFLACSAEAGEYHYGKRRFTQVKNAIDLKKYAFNTSTRNTIRKKMGIEDYFVIGTVGRLEEIKNPEGIVDIFFRFLEIHEKTKFLWIGEGSMKETIVELLNKKGILDKVIMTGAIDNVNEILQAMDVFILPSFSEGLSIACVEAQATGLPTLCSEFVPKENAVTNLCYFIDLNDYSLWTKRICEILESNNPRIDTSAYIKENGYDIDCESKKLVELYIKLLNI